MDKADLKILLLEDDAVDADLLERQLTRDNLKITTKRVDTRQEFTDAIKEFEPDVILSDHSLPQFNSLAALEIARRERPDAPFILVTGTVSEEFAVTCIKAGADDYLLKSNLVRLSSAIKAALAKRSLQLENVLIKRLNEEIKEKNKNITDSINYALNIQNALMQEKTDLLEYLPQSFIFLQPRNIVSGDFYWFRHLNGRCLIAAGDCTGHGVPGALLTIMGMNMLQAGIGTHKISNVSELLNYVDKNLYKKFTHKKKGKAVNDGMDIAICDININEMSLTLSGANSSVYLVHEGNIEQIGTDKYQLGNGDVQKDFALKTRALQKGDTIYLATDGFRDQFGGERGKKLGSTHFREYLLALSHEDFNKQENILANKLSTWQGHEEQTDDTLVIGIRI